MLFMFMRSKYKRMQFACSVCQLRMQSRASESVSGVGPALLVSDASAEHQALPEEGLMNKKVRLRRQSGRGNALLCLRLAFDFGNSCSGSQHTPKHPLANVVMVPVSMVCSLQ